jgi:2-methylcitrate dehydratase
MTFPRDLVWQNLDLVYRSSIAYQFARYSLGLTYEMLPPDVIRQAKRCLLDALGCAIGAYEAPGRSVCETVAKDLGGPEEATVFCSGLRTGVLNATLVNSFLVRYLDANDIGGGGHNSDSIPCLLAVSEREKADGRAFLTSLVISYELGARVRESCPSLMGGNWTPDVRGGLSMPPALGTLMGLNEDQIANAMGICACHSLPLGILDQDREENSMAKNLRFGFVAYNAILSCMLAKQGFTGPVRIVEGNAGIREVIANNEMDFQVLTDFSGWRILNTKFKTTCANGTTIGHLLATLSVVREHDLKPEDIESVLIRACPRECRHTTTPAKKYPRNAESADHSAHFVNAVAIKDRDFGPESFSPENFTDPVVLDLIEKIRVEPDPAMPAHQGSCVIATKDGRKFQENVDAPGLDRIPLTDGELENKFQRMASVHMDAQRIQRLFDTVWDLEKINDMSMLTRLMALEAI